MLITILYCQKNNYVYIFKDKIYGKVQKNIFKVYISL